MLVSDITKKIRNRLRERGNTSRFSDDALLDYLNDVRLEIADFIQGERKKIDITPTDGKVYLPADVLRIERVAVNSLEIPPLTPTLAALESADYSGGAIGYIFRDGYLKLIPSYTETVTLQYIGGLASFLSVDQEYQVDDIYVMALVYGVLEQCFIELGDTQRGAYFNGKFEKEKRDRRRTMRMKVWKNAKAPWVPGLER